MPARIKYTLSLVIVIFLGLASRSAAASHLPAFLRLYAGDTLWATAAFCGFALLMPEKTSLTLAIFALVFSFAIELSQLYHAGWIDVIRGTRLGALILGFGFLWTDLVCYAVGVALGVMLDVFVVKRKFKLATN